MKNHEVPHDKVYADSLTWREQDILKLLAQRLTNREIAQRLHLAESTVKDYVGKILSKLYVKNRRQAVERAKALGLLESERERAVIPPANLPAEATPFIGRVDELAEIKQLLKETPLLTLTGPGGIGKTRLALKTASELTADFEHGSFFVPLAPIHSVEHIIQTIAEAVKFPLATHENPQRQLLRYLQKRHLLLVMDNFEHLLEGAGIVSEILQAAPGVKILVTSRERLNLQREISFIVGGMSLPELVPAEEDGRKDAIHLFIQSASKVRPGFTPSPEELGQIINICQIVEGLPLAIELAAAWLHILSAEEIVEELEKGLDILAVDVRDAPERHRSIRAVFDHSWSMLDQKEQEIFKRLSVFRGGLTRGAAQKVSGASLQHLAELVNKSFLNHDPDAGRFEVHELLRQYAQDRLGATPDASISAHEAHAAYFADFMHQRWEDLKSNRQMAALSEIEADIENVRTAWRYYLDQGNISQLWKFIKSLWRFYWIQWWNHAGMELFAEATVALQQVEQDEESESLRALSMAFQAWFMAWLDLADEGYDLVDESMGILEKFGNSEPLLFACYSLGVNAYMLYRIPKDTQAMDKALEIAYDLDDKWLIGLALFGAGWSAILNGDYEKARKLAKRNLNLYEEIGDMIGATTPDIILGHAALAFGEHEEAREYYLRCLRRSEKTGFYYSLQTASKYLGKVSISMGNTIDADRYLAQSLTIARDIGFVRDIVNLVYEFARLRVMQEEFEQAVELLSLVIQHPASQQKRWLEGRIRDSAKDLLSSIEDELAKEGYLAALERGRGLDLDETASDLLR